VPWLHPAGNGGRGAGNCRADAGRGELCPAARKSWAPHLSTCLRSNSDRHRRLGFRAGCPIFGKSGADWERHEAAPMPVPFQTPSRDSKWCGRGIVSSWKRIDHRVGLRDQRRVAVPPWPAALAKNVPQRVTALGRHLCPLRIAILFSRGAIEKDGNDPGCLMWTARSRCPWAVPVAPVIPPCSPPIVLAPRPEAY